MQTVGNFRKRNIAARTARLFVVHNNNLLTVNSGKIIAGVLFLALLGGAAAVTAEAVSTSPKSSDLSSAPLNLPAGGSDVSQLNTSSVTPVSEGSSDNSDISDGVSANLSSTSNNNSSSTSVTVNGQSVSVPANGTTVTNVGNSHVVVSHNENSSGTNSNDTTTTLNVDNNSDLTNEGN